jgi:hypothetical protein
LSHYCLGWLLLPLKFSQELNNIKTHVKQRLVSNIKTI